MTDLTAPLASALAQVAVMFDMAAAGGPDCVLEAVAGIRGLLAAGMVADDHAAPAEVIADLVSAIAAAAPAVSAATEPRIPSEAVHLGLAAASGFASLFGRAPAEVAATADLPLAADRIDHAAVLADELDAYFRRQRIEARGDLLRRSLTIRRALNAAPAGAALH